MAILNPPSPDGGFFMPETSNYSLPRSARRQCGSDRPVFILTPLGPPGSLLQFKFQFIGRDAPAGNAGLKGRQLSLHPWHHPIRYCFELFKFQFVAPSCTVPQRPHLTRGLSAKLTGGEKKPRLCNLFLSLRPFGPPPSSEGGRALPRHSN